MTRFNIPALTQALCALALCTVAASPVAAQTTLRYQFKEGETLNYAMDQKMKMTTSVMTISSAASAKRTPKTFSIESVLT